MTINKALKSIFCGVVSLCAVIAIPAMADSPTPNVQGIWPGSKNLTISFNSFENGAPTGKNSITAPAITGVCTDGTCSYQITQIILNGQQVDPTQCHQNVSKGPLVNPETNNPSQPSSLVIMVNGGGCTIAYRPL